MLKNILLFPLLALLVGCVSTVNLSPEAKSQLKTIHISHAVPVPENMLYYGKNTQLMSSIGVLLDAPIGKQLEKEVPPPEIKDITITAFKNALNKTRYHLINDKADATMTITVTGYGFVISSFIIGDMLNPQFHVVATLTNKNHQIIWRKSADITSFTSNTQRVSEAELLAHPEKLRSAYQSVAEIAANQIVSTLN